MPSKLHMTVPRRFHKFGALPAVLKLYYVNLQDSDWVEQQGYRITTPIRTLLDLATTRQISDDLLQQAVQEGRKKGIITKHHIEALPPGEVRSLLKKFYEKTVSFRMPKTLEKAWKSAFKMRRKKKESTCKEYAGK